MDIKYVGVDTETTGLVPGSDEIVSVAVQLLDSDLNNVGEPMLIHAYPSSEELMSPEARAINGYDRDEWAARGSITQEELADQMRNFIAGVSGAYFLGHNVGFDVAFIKALVGAEFYEANVPEQVVCTMDLSYRMKRSGALVSANVRLGVVCEALGIKLSNAHSALPDMEASVCLARKYHARWPFDGSHELSYPRKMRGR